MIIFLLYALAAIRIVISYVHIVTTSAPDFAYYFDASLTARGLAPVTGHLLPPFSILAYWPLALVGFGFSQVIWITASFAALLSVPFLLRRLFPRMTESAGAVILTAAAWSFPTLFTLGMGQVNMVVLSLLLVSVLLFVKSLHGCSGIVLGLSMLLKPELLLLAGVPILFAGRRMLRFFLGTLIIAVVLSLVIYGWGAYTGYFERIISVFLSSDGAGVYYNQSASALLMRMGITDSGFRMAVSAILLGAGYYMVARKRSGYTDAIWSLLPSFIVAEPVAFQHHFVFLIPSYIAAWIRTGSAVGKGMIILSFILISINVSNPESLRMYPLNTIALSHATIGAFILMAALFR